MRKLTVVGVATGAEHTAVVTSSGEVSRRCLNAYSTSVRKEGGDCLNKVFEIKRRRGAPDIITNRTLNARILPLYYAKDQLCEGFFREHCAPTHVFRIHADTDLLSAHVRLFVAVPLVLHLGAQQPRPIGIGRCQPNVFA